MVNIIKCSREVIDRKDNLLYELVLKIKDLYNSESLVFNYSYNMDFKRVVKEFLLYDSTYYNFFDLYIKWLSTPHIGRRSCVNMMHESGFSNEDISRLVKMSVENVDNYIGEKNKIGREQDVVENWSKELNEMLEVGLVEYNEDSKIVMFLKEFVDMLYERKVFKDKIKVLNIIYEFVDKMIKKHYKK